MARRWRELLPLTAVLALALLLRFLPLEHGAPRNYLPDTHAVRAALGMAKDKDLAPPVGKYSTYPYLMPYLLLPVYGAQYALGKANGEWRGPEEYGNFVAAHPERVAVPARALVACFGVLTALAVYAASRAAGLRRGALAAAFLTATGLLHVQMSVQERPWVIVVLFGGLCLWALLDYAKTRRLRSLIAAGALAGLSFATHQAGGFFALLVAATWCFSAPRAGDWRGKPLWTRVSGALLAALACVVVGVLCGHGYYLFHGSVGGEHMAGGTRAAEHFSIGGQALRTGFSWQSFLHLGSALAGYDPVLLVLGVLGLPFAWRIACLRGPLLFTLAYAAFFLFNPSDHVRYLLPLTVLLALPAGVVCDLVMERRLGRVAVLVLFSLPLLQASRLVWLLRQEDTRAEAERRIELLVSNPSSSLRVAIDHNGPQVELSRKALEELALLRPLRTREERRLALLKAGLESGARPGVPAIFVEELFGFDDASGSYTVASGRRNLAPTPVAMFQALGITHFVLVDRRPARPLDGTREPYLGPLAAGWSPVWSIDPSRPQGTTDEALLPTEMDFPLRGLWSVDRPGPKITLYALP
ncbi:MAG: glycosyltransferase family 39 protein [Planctomycetes bacterium]|nr:glycosyltransferase family 39 protein [Planctomycetota bacterium]